MGGFRLCRNFIPEKIAIVAAEFQDGYSLFFAHGRYRSPLPRHEALENAKAFCNSAAEPGLVDYINAEFLGGQGGKAFRYGHIAPFIAKDNAPGYRIAEKVNIAWDHCIGLRYYAICYAIL